MPKLTPDDGATLGYQLVLPATRSAKEVSFIFQHGMGGDLHQPLGYVKQIEQTPLICMDARGHGTSSDIVEDRCSFDAFADDVLALADHLGFEKFIMGGISLGAGTALNAAVRYPDRMAGLVLCRPAWLEHSQAKRNTDVYNLIADLLEHHEPDQALLQLTSSKIYQDVKAESESAAQSLRHQITRPRAAANREILRRFPTSAPTPDRRDWAGITVPTLVVGHQDDPFHLWDIAQTYADIIPTAQLVEVTSKDRDAQMFSTQVDTAISGFVDSINRKHA